MSDKQEGQQVEREIWLTCYALEGPVYPVRAALSAAGNMWSRNEAFDPSEWKPTRKGALAQARRIRNRRIRELQMEIKRLEKLNRQ